MPLTTTTRPPSPDQVVGTRDSCQLPCAREVHPTCVAPSHRVHESAGDSSRGWRGGPTAHDCVDFSRASWESPYRAAPTSSGCWWSCARRCPAWAHSSLAALLAVAEGGAAAGLTPAAAVTLIDEKRTYFEFMNENHAKLKEDQLPALGFFNKYNNRPHPEDRCCVSLLLLHL